VLLIFPLFITVLLIIKKNKLQDPNFKQRVGSLYNEIRVDSTSALMFQTIFVLRRLHFAFIAIVLKDYPFL
jgi:hypothetical protein